MLTTALRRWAAKSALPATTIDLISRIFDSPPSRSVEAGTRNVSGAYPSAKMGVTIQFESHRHEFAHVMQWEHTPDVVAYVCQPPAILFERPDIRGRMRAFYGTPDYFVVSNDFVGWVEIKPVDKLPSLAARHPHHYVRTGGEWTCPPGQRYATAFGLNFRVLTEHHLNRVFVRNCEYLEDYTRGSIDLQGKDPITQAQRVLHENGSLRLRELYEQVPELTPDLFHTGIIKNAFFVDLHEVFVGEVENVRVFRDEVTARALATFRPPGGEAEVVVAAGKFISWHGQSHQIAWHDNQTVALLKLGESIVELPKLVFDQELIRGKITGVCASIREAMDPALNLLARASDKAKATALARLNQLTQSASQTPARTIRDWRRKTAIAEINTGSGLVGLLDRRWNSGNHNPKLPEQVLTVTSEFIGKEFESLRNEPVAAAYRRLQNYCTDNLPEWIGVGKPYPSQKTFAKMIKDRDPATQIAAREGPRAAYSLEIPYMDLEYGTPQHGDHPWHIGHIDSTEIDLESLGIDLLTHLGRAWLSIMMLAYPRKVVAAYLTYDPPSTYTNLALVRICVRRFGRAPQVLVCDNGSENRAIDFHTLTAFYGITRKQRPRRNPRAGSVLERWFLTSNTTFFHTLLGNTQVMTRVRQVTKSVSPKHQACWTLPAIYLALCHWAYHIYDQEPHTGIHSTPRDRYEEGMVSAGAREHRLISYSEHFKIMTLPRVSRGTSQIGRHGVRANGFNYWNKLFRYNMGTTVPVRYDSDDITVAYAQLDGVWLKAICDRHTEFNGMSEAQLQVVTAQYRKKYSATAKAKAISSVKLLEFLRTLSNKELDLLRARDKARAAVNSLIDSGIEDVTSPAADQLWHQEPNKDFVLLPDANFPKANLSDAPSLENVSEEAPSSEPEQPTLRPRRKLEQI